MKEYLIKQTSDTGGDSVDTTSEPIFGRLYAVTVVDGNLADNFDITLTYANAQAGTITLLTLTNLSADKIYYPRTLVQGLDGVDLTGTAGGDREMQLVAGVVTSTLADGGSLTSGSVLLYIVD